MLDLNARVHLHEEKPPVLVQQELDRARIPIAHRLGRFHCYPAQFPTQAVVHRGRRAFFDQLLIPTLDRAIPLPDRNRAAPFVREDLHLDMARLEKILFDVDGLISEGGSRFRTRGLKGMS